MSYQFEDPLTSTPSLTGTSWKLVELEGSEPMKPITLSFDLDNFVYGWSGCNRYRGRHMISGNTYNSGGDFATTKQICLEPGVSDMENNYLNLMQSNTFFIEVDSTGDEDELIFYERALVDLEPIQGDVVARYVKCNECG